MKMYCKSLSYLCGNPGWSADYKEYVQKRLKNIFKSS